MESSPNMTRAVYAPQYEFYRVMFTFIPTIC